MHDYPPSWVKGELLDVKRYTTGNFRVTRIGDDASSDDLFAMDFSSTEDCQEFISWWYTPEAGRGAA